MNFREEDYEAIFLVANRSRLMGMASNNKTLLKKIFIS